MNSKSSYNPTRPRSITKLVHASFRLVALGIFCEFFALSSALAADAPAWMRALVSVPVPPHDEKTEAVLLYSENILNVQGNGKIKSIEEGNSAVSVTGALSSCESLK